MIEVGVVQIRSLAKAESFRRFCFSIARRNAGFFAGYREGRGYTIRDDRRAAPFKENLTAGAEFVGKYQFPKLKKTKYIPENLIAFNELKRTKERKGTCVHFFIDDYQFERIWNSPERYKAVIQECEGMITPDFSMYHWMSVAQRIWNMYRSRTISYWMQKEGIEVIPVIEWGRQEDLRWCLDGVPKQSVVAIGLYGCRRNNKSRYFLLKGFEEACRRLEPIAVVAYGEPVQEMEGLCRKILWFPSYCRQMRSRL